MRKSVRLNGITRINLALLSEFGGPVRLNNVGVLALCSEKLPQQKASTAMLIVVNLKSAFWQMLPTLYNVGYPIGFYLQLGSNGDKVCTVLFVDYEKGHFKRWYFLELPTRNELQQSFCDTRFLPVQVSMLERLHTAICFIVFHWIGIHV